MARQQGASVSTAQHMVQVKMDSIYGDAGASLAQHRNMDVCTTEHAPLLPEGISQCPLGASGHPGKPNRPPQCVSDRRTYSPGNSPAACKYFYHYVHNVF